MIGYKAFPKPYSGREGTSAGELAVVYFNISESAHLLEDTSHVFLLPFRARYE